MDFIIIVFKSQTVGSYRVDMLPYASQLQVLESMTLVVCWI